MLLRIVYLRVTATNCRWKRKAARRRLELPVYAHVPGFPKATDKTKLSHEKRKKHYICVFKSKKRKTSQWSFPSFSGSKRVSEPIRGALEAAARRKHTDSSANTGSKSLAVFPRKEVKGCLLHQDPENTKRSF